jgi:predicted Ser/Thr protein kinase/negative regulator of sigma E activity
MEVLQPGDPGSVGDYRLLGRLGAGGMGQVFLGVSPGGRKVAVKLIHPVHARDPQFRERFAREIEAAQRVGGFHTAPVVDADPHADPPWMVTAYIEGPSLQEAVGRGGPLPPGTVRAVGAGLAEGLAAIHGRGLVHRDLKPGNVIMAADGPRIIDFGIARALDATTGITATGAVVGTYAYMSPEQFRGEVAGPASDVFSLGSVLGFAATGRPPFGSDSALSIMYRVVNEPPDLAALADDQLRGLITACLAKSSLARPAVRAVLAALRGPGPESAVPRAPVGAAPAAVGYEMPTQTPAPAPVAPGPGPEALFPRSTVPPAEAVPSATAPPPWAVPPGGVPPKAVPSRSGHARRSRRRTAVLAGAQRLQERTTAARAGSAEPTPTPTQSGPGAASNGRRRFPRLRRSLLIPVASAAAVVAAVVAVLVATLGSPGGSSALVGGSPAGSVGGAPAAAVHSGTSTAGTSSPPPTTPAALTGSPSRRAAAQEAQTTQAPSSVQTGASAHSPASPTPTATPPGPKSISGTYTFTRQVITCTFSSCGTNPIVVTFSCPSAGSCTAYWAYWGTHAATFDGSTIDVSFTATGSINCKGTALPTAVTLDINVLSWTAGQGGAVRTPTRMQGSYTESAPASDLGCPAAGTQQTVSYG